MSIERDYGSGRYNTDTCHIAWLWINHCDRGKGHGGELLHWMETELARSGCLEVSLFAEKTDQSSGSFHPARFYCKHRYTKSNITFSRKMHKKIPWSIMINTDISNLFLGN